MSKIPTILFLAANPKQTDRLQLSTEAREIEEGLRRAKKRFHFEPVWGVSSTSLRRALLDHKPQYVHFCGHGAESEGILLEDDNGIAEFTGTEALAELFSLFSDTIECVILNCCYSKAQARLIAREISYAIGFEKEVDDKTSRDFAIAFYDALGARQSIDFSFKLGCNAIRLTMYNKQTAMPELFDRDTERLVPANGVLYSECQPQYSQDYSSELDRSIERGRLPLHDVEAHLGLDQDYEIEKVVWNLMAQDFYWAGDMLTNLRVQVGQPSEKNISNKVKFNIFDVVMVAVFAQLQPEYDWWITPNSSIDGVNFFGRGVFLTSRELNIDAAVTIGGQCQKREGISDLVTELSGNFLRMEQAIHPTLFVAVFSARLTVECVTEARRTLEGALKRHCYILGRTQIESLIGYYLPVVERIVRQVLSSNNEIDLTLDYFRRKSPLRSELEIEVFSPSSVLSGEPFCAHVQITRSSICGSSFRLKWESLSQERGLMTLVAPIGGDSEEGTPLDFQIEGSEDPFLVEYTLEFLTYSIGSQPLGRIEIHSITKGPDPVCTTVLPTVYVAENLRPPFYDIPYRNPLDEIERGLVRASSGRVSCVAIVGAGGAGKTRLCEEICLDAKRHGTHVLSARQAHSTEFPRRILANLLLDLTKDILSDKISTDRIDYILSRVEPKLAERARPAIEALFEQAGKSAHADDDQSLLSVLAVLIAQRSQKSTVVIHLHDLHWCTVDVLEVIDRLIWQLDHLKLQKAHGAPTTGMRVLFLLEGRLHEHRESEETGWSTRMYEKFIERLACPIARCRAFDNAESAVFARRLFEQEHSSNRMLPRPLLALQVDLIDTITRAAGGNPLHLLEQIKLLQQHGVLAQNPHTGFIYMIRPEFGHIQFPSTVFEIIEARWRYYWINEKDLAILLWAAALVDDNLPAPLFRYLWMRLAPTVSQSRIESAEFLRLPQNDEEGTQVSFRHENYFRTVRRIQLSEHERRPVMAAYSNWFNSAKHLSPSLRYAQARIELEEQNPDLQRVRKCLRLAQKGALKQQDRSLASRILATLLDNVTWPLYEQTELTEASLLKACDDEVALCTMLVNSGRTDVAYERINNTLGIVEARIGTGASQEDESIREIMERRFRFLMMKAKILFHGRRPAEAVAITDNAVKELNALVAGLADNEQWMSTIMEVHDTHSAAVALAGDLRRAVVEARVAARIAETLLEKELYALDVIITFANILLSEEPEESEATLESYLYFVQQSSVQESTKLRLLINLSMARILLGYRASRSGSLDENRLLEAQRVLLSVFRKAFPLGRLKDASAAALLLGLIYALWGKSDDIDWFSQSTALAIRSRQLETLWRAHINLAHSLHRSGKSASDSAAAALEIMSYSLSSYVEPDRNPRFDLLAVPMAHAVRYLLLERDSKAMNALRRFPALRGIFSDVEAGELKEDRGGRLSHEWLRIGTADYVLY